MKNITIEVPSTGAAVQFLLRSGSTSGQAVIVASDDVEIRLAEFPPALATQLASGSTGKAPSAKTPSRDLDAIFKRLSKLKPAKRAAAINSIKAMFQLTSPISSEEAGTIFESLRKRGLVSTDADDKLQLRNT